MRATHITPSSAASGTASSLPRPEPREIADAITVRASASHAERLARLAVRHSHTVAGRRPHTGRQQPNRAGAAVCSDLELAVLALHGTSQFAAAARLASAPGQALAYTRTLAGRHGVVAEPGDRHRYAVALRAFAAEDRLLTQRAEVLGDWLKAHWDAQAGAPAGDGDFVLDAYLHLLLAEHHLAADNGEPATDAARAALRCEAHSLQLAARRLAAWARVTAEWLYPGLDQVAPSWINDPRLLPAGTALIC
ncbi:hypothetical protein [Catenulispora subtropica]|uniref:Uncharacterized protein n=1 Tax=Catenulispora subtropica TaxID=450798 RepID=A0ABN2RAZ4_9ACTN